MSWFNRKVLQTLSGMLIRADRHMDDVQAGTVFRRVHDDDLVETAEVDSVSADRYGVPHVRFKVIFSRVNRFSYEEGTRMLALRPFVDRYNEQVAEEFQEPAPVAPA
jgi:hypothetical protein